ncbi:MAG: hypothetical protein V3T77_08500, partial [Planctomycetota bacterium]
TKIGVLVVLLGLCWWAGSLASPPVPLSTCTPPPPPTPQKETSCVGGCRAVQNPLAPLRPAEIQELLARVAASEPGVATPALETLLFHGRQVAGFVERHGLGGWGAETSRFLRGQLALLNAVISVRVVDADGVCRMTLKESVPIGEKQHLHPSQSIELTPPEVSLTVQRVGLYHLWTRI